MNIIEIQTAKTLQYLEMATQLDYIGEPVSQLQHALQCAYFAKYKNHHEDVILACLLHDIGHFASQTKQLQMDKLGVVHHEWIGAKLVYDLGFSAKVALLIGYHVHAKRYLAAKNISYYAKLSTASKQTLAFQGGPMSKNEMQIFQKPPLFKEILQVRINDERGKQVPLKVPGLKYYQNTIQSHLEKNIHRNQKSSFVLTDFIDDKWVEGFREELETSLSSRALCTGPTHK